MNKDVIKVFIGYDEVESVAWHVMAHSILRNSTKPVAIVPINLKNLKNVYSRERDPKQSNEFSFSRFLVPYLCDYKGYGVFFDCDMLVTCDISEIMEYIDKDPDKAVYVVKHNYEPRNDIKYLNTVQYKYPRKNWSSVVLWNAGHEVNKKLTPDFVNTATGMELHRFQWMDDSLIGELDVKWNWLVGEYDEPPSDIKNIHWTIGGPYFNEYKDSDFSAEWYDEKEKMMNCIQREK